MEWTNPRLDASGREKPDRTVEAWAFEQDSNVLFGEVSGESLAVRTQLKIDGYSRRTALSARTVAT